MDEIATARVAGVRRQHLTRLATNLFHAQSVGTGDEILRNLFGCEAGGLRGRKRRRPSRSYSLYKLTDRHSWREFGEIFEGVGSKERWQLGDGSGNEAAPFLFALYTVDCLADYQKEDCDEEGET